jgi:uncharacterized lipoprotein YmbA
MNRLGLWLILTAFAGCSAQPAKTRYYTLTSTQADVRVAASAPGAELLRLAVGPVTVPETLDRPQLVLRHGDNRYAIADHARWAEPLKREIPRVLAEKLSRELPSFQVAAHTQYMGRNADYGVLIDVHRFESRLGQEARIEVVWSIVGRDGNARQQQTSQLTERVAGPTITALVAAHGRVLDRLGTDIAAAVRALPGGYDQGIDAAPLVPR